MDRGQLHKEGCTSPEPGPGKGIWVRCRQHRLHYYQENQMPLPPQVLSFLPTRSRLLIPITIVLAILTEVNLFCIVII